VQRKQSALLKGMQCCALERDMLQGFASMATLYPGRQLVDDRRPERLPVVRPHLPGTLEQ